jgi:hypothetical protein
MRVGAAVGFVSFQGDCRRPWNAAAINVLAPSQTATSPQVLRGTKTDMERPVKLFQGSGFGFRVSTPSVSCSRRSRPSRLIIWPERRAAVKGAPFLGAAKRNLDGEHRSGIDTASTGGGAGT